MEADGAARSRARSGQDARVPKVDLPLLLKPRLNEVDHWASLDRPHAKRYRTHAPACFG